MLLSASVDAGEVEGLDEERERKDKKGKKNPNCNNTIQIDEE